MKTNYQQTLFKKSNSVTLVLIFVLSFFVSAAIKAETFIDPTSQKALEQLVKGKYLAQTQVTYTIVSTFTKPQLCDLLEMFHDGALIVITYNMSELFIEVGLVKNGEKYYYYHDTYDPEKSPGNNFEHYAYHRYDTYQWDKPGRTAEEIADTIATTTQQNPVGFVVYHPINFHTVYPNPINFLTSTYSSSPSNSALLLASYIGSPESVSFLIEKKVDVSKGAPWERFTTPLVYVLGKANNSGRHIKTAALILKELFENGKLKTLDFIYQPYFKEFIHNNPNLEQNAIIAAITEIMAINMDKISDMEKERETAALIEFLGAPIDEAPKYEKVITPITYSGIIAYYESYLATAINTLIPLDIEKEEKRASHKQKKERRRTVRNQKKEL